MNNCIKYYNYNHIPKNVRDVIWEMECELAKMFSKSAQEKHIGLEVQIPTYNRLFSDKCINYCVCCNKKNVIGYVSYYVNEHESGFDNGCINIKNVFVDKKYRKMGIAKLMLRDIMCKYDKYYYQFCIYGENKAYLNLFRSVGLYTEPLYSVYAFHTNYSDSY